MPIKYEEGDATNPTGVGPKIISHICNDSGYFGRGFVLALAAKWPQVQAQYNSLIPKGSAHPEKLGTVQFVEVEKDLVVANMIAQRGIRASHDGTLEGCPPIRYPALFKCLKEVASYARSKKAEISAPRFGSGLALGSWITIEALIEKAFPDIPITIYDLPKTAQAVPQAIPTGQAVLATGGDPLDPEAWK